MFCPGCQCEYRPGFTRCVPCDAELVESLDAIDRSSVDVPTGPTVAVTLADYCGYLDLDEARAARDRLSIEKIQAEIAIRLSDEPGPEGGALEEYWLRVDASEAARIKALLEEVESPTATQERASLMCSRCDRPVREDESFCANCGTRFTA